MLKPSTGLSRKEPLVITKLQFEAVPLKGRVRRWRLRANKGKHFTQEGVEKILVDFAEEFARQNPEKEYNLIPLKQEGGTKRFRLVEVEKVEASEGEQA